MIERLRYAIVRRLADLVLRQLEPAASMLRTRRRLGTITPEQRESLAQIEEWIKSWELRTLPPQCGKPMLAALAPLNGFRVPFRCGLPPWHTGKCGCPVPTDDGRREERPN